MNRARQAAAILVALLCMGGALAFGTVLVTTVDDPDGRAWIVPGGTSMEYADWAAVQFTFNPSPSCTIETEELWKWDDLSQEFRRTTTYFHYGTRPKTRTFSLAPGVYEVRVHAREGLWHQIWVDVVGPGTVTFDPSGEPIPPTVYRLFEEGAVVHITATAFPGCVFAGWDGDVAESDRYKKELDITMGDGAWAAQATFDLAQDTLPPLNPAIDTPGHTIGIWTSEASVAIEVYGASDEGSGVGGYEFDWSQSATWVPTGSSNRGSDWTGETLIASGDGAWYFHLATVDSVGNWSQPISCGPLNIDTTPPQIGNCPGLQTWYAAPGLVSTSVYWAALSATDALDPSPALTSDYLPGGSFPLGDTRVTYVAVDHAGNKTLCVFVVKVIQLAAGTGVANSITTELAGTGYGSEAIATIADAAYEAIAGGSPAGTALALVHALVVAGTPAPRFLELVEQYRDLIAAGTPPGLALNKVLGKGSGKR